MGRRCSHFFPKGPRIRQAFPLNQRPQRKVIHDPKYISAHSEKNNSNYCKKQQDENKCELQNLHKLVMEAYEHSKELDQKGYGEQSLNFQSEKNNFKHKPKSVYTQQNNSN